MIERQKVNAVLVTLKCDQCHNEMERSPFVLTSNPPIYEYVCGNGHMYKTTGLFPYIAYEDEGGNLVRRA